MPKGYVYGYRNRATGRWAYVGQALDLSKRPTRYRRKGVDVKGPILLETVTGRNLRDLAFNLTWQETVWIFKCKTLRRIWPEGLNVRAYMPRTRYRRARLWPVMAALPLDVHREIKKLADENRRSLNNEIIRAVEQHLTFQEVSRVAASAR